MSQLWGRREFLRIASLGPMGLGLGDYLSLRAQSPTQSDKSCIMLVLDGGMSHHDTFDLKPDAPSDVRTHIQLDRHEGSRYSHLRASAARSATDG